MAILCSAGACVWHATRQPLFAFVFAAADAINAAVVAISIAIATCRFVLIPICGCVECPSPALTLATTLARTTVDFMPRRGKLKYFKLPRPDLNARF